MRLHILMEHLTFFKLDLLHRSNSVRKQGLHKSQSASLNSRVGIAYLATSPMH
jgi:hypothetical protein